MQTIEVDTPIGQMVLKSDDVRLIQKYQKNIENYFNRKKPSLSFEDFDTEGTPFQKKVLEVLFSVPYGETISYKELAKHAGYPKAIRAVASVVAQNKHYIFIPCHRVVRSDGGLGQYGAGIERKAWLLKHEGAVKHLTFDI